MCTDICIQTHRCINTHADTQTLMQTLAHIEVPQNSLWFKYRAGHNFSAVEWVYKEIYLLIEPLWSTPESSQASKGAQNELKMTKMTFQRKKMTKVIRIDKQAPFLDWSPCQRMERGVRLDIAIFSKNLGLRMTQNRPRNVKKLTIHEKKWILMKGILT